MTSNICIFRICQRSKKRTHLRFLWNIFCQEKCKQLFEEFQDFAIVDKKRYVMINHGLQWTIALTL